MRKEYDFSKSKRAKNIPHLARLQAESKGKTRITIMVDNDLLVAFRAKADALGMGYQTLINEVLREHLGTEALNTRTLRKIIREEINRAGA